MENQIKHANHLSQNAAIDIYLSGGNGRVYWPNRLQPAIRGDSTPGVREACQQYMLDSGFDEDGVPMEQVIEMAYERQPKYVIPNDTVNTPDVAMRTAVEETAAKVDEFLSLINENTFPATVLVPLQPPHTFHYAYLHEHYPEQAQRGHFALGGLKNATPAQQVTALQAFRDVAGYEPYVHGFGLGASPEVLDALRENPALIDSVDFSTPQTHGMSAREAGHPRIPMRLGLVGGDDQASTAARRIEAELYELARYLDPEKSAEDVEIRWDKYRDMWEKIGNRLQKEDVIQDYTVLEPVDDEQTAIDSFAHPESNTTES